jgi:hypothetical protein
MQIKKWDRKQIEGLSQSQLEEFVVICYEGMIDHNLPRRIRAIHWRNRKIAYDVLDKKVGI